MALETIEKQTVTVSELARILGLNVEYVRRELIGRNRIRHLRLSRRTIRIPVSAVREFLDSERRTDRGEGVSEDVQ
jgi:excisionase family DNA binding protein